MQSQSSLVALSYAIIDDLQPGTKSELRGWIARFARGSDYHREMKSRLTKLCESLQSRLGVHAEFKAFCDTGPLSDRSAAIRAGIGLTRDETAAYTSPDLVHGLYLAKSSRTIEIEPDVPLNQRTSAETGRKCIDACPTGRYIRNRCRRCTHMPSHRLLNQKVSSLVNCVRSLKHASTVAMPVREVCPLNKAGRMW